MAAAHVQLYMYTPHVPTRIDAKGIAAYLLTLSELMQSGGGCTNASIRDTLRCFELHRGLVLIIIRKQKTIGGILLTLKLATQVLHCVHVLICSRLLGFEELCWYLPALTHRLEWKIERLSPWHQYLGKCRKGVNRHCKRNTP